MSAPVWASQTVYPHIRWRPHRDYLNQPAAAAVLFVAGVAAAAAAVAVVVVVH